MPLPEWYTSPFRYKQADLDQLDLYNKQIEEYKTAAEAYNAALDKYKTDVELYNERVNTWNAGPRTSDFGYKPPAEFTMAQPAALEFTQEDLDAFQQEAQARATRAQQARNTAYTAAINPSQYNLAGFSFADGGEASKARLAYNKMFPQKFFAGGPAVATMTAPQAVAPAAGITAQEASDPSVAQALWNFLSGADRRKAEDTEAYLRQPVEQPAAQRLDNEAYAAALREAGVVVGPNADEMEKRRREMERLSRPGGFAPAPELPSTPGFEPPTIDTAPTSLPAAEQLKGLPGFKPVKQSPEDLIMRSEDDAENTLRFSDKRFKQLASEHEADPFDYPSGMVSAGVAWVNPMDVVNATTYGKEEIDRLRKEVAEQGPTDMDILEGDILPYINIEKTPSGDVKVTQQEGRHRMIRLADMGYTRVPVRFVNRDAESGETSLLDLPANGQLAGKQKGSTSLPYENLVEITPQNRQLLKSEFGQQAKPGTARSALDAFTKQALQNAKADSRLKSREVVVEMDIDDYLNLAAPGEERAKTERLSTLTKFDQVPLLNTDGEQVTGHEGRHRARRMKELGYTTMPVRIIDQNVRWGENPNTRFDTLKAQRGDFSIPHPVQEGEYGVFWENLNRPANVDKIEVENGSLNVYTDIENQRDNRPLINDFLVKEDKRGQGIGTGLIKTTLEKYPNAGANASNEGAVRAMYRAGMRSQDYPRASEDALVEQVKENPVYMVANPKPETYESDYFSGGVLEPEYANGGEVTNFIRKRAEGSPPSGELSAADRQTQLDIMRDMMLAEKVAAYLGPNNERGEFNPEEFYPHMLGRGNDYNVKVSPGGIASPSWNKEGSIPYTSLETGERTEYPIRPGTINTYGRDSYDPYVIAHEIDHDERHKWDVFAANMSPEQDRDEEIRVRRNDLLYAPDQASWKRAVNNYYNFFNPGNETEFADKEDAVMKSLMYTANKYPEDIPESRQAEDTYWRTRNKELNPSLLDYIKSMLSK